MWVSLPEGNSTEGVTDAVRASGLVRQDRALDLQKDWTENGNRWLQFKVTKKF